MSTSSPDSTDGQQRVLLGLVEPVHLVEEQDRALAPLAEAVLGPGRGLAHVLHRGGHRGELLEGLRRGAGDELGDRGLAGARRPPEDHRRQPVGLDQRPQRAAGAEQVLLADDVVERGRAQARRQRGLADQAVLGGGGEEVLGHRVRLPPWGASARGRRVPRFARAGCARGALLDLGAGGVGGLRLPPLPPGHPGPEGEARGRRGRAAPRARAREGCRSRLGTGSAAAPPRRTDRGPPAPVAAGRRRRRRARRRAVIPPGGPADADAAGPARVRTRPSPADADRPPPIGMPRMVTLAEALQGIRMPEDLLPLVEPGEPGLVDGRRARFGGTGTNVPTVAVALGEELAPPRLRRRRARDRSTSARAGLTADPRRRSPVAAVVDHRRRHRRGGRRAQRLTAP